MSGPTQDNNPEFKYFPKLPIELREQIWHHILPEARVIEIRWEENTNEYFTFAKFPVHEVIFKVCRESRNYAMGNYTLLEFENDVDIDSYDQDIVRESDAEQQDDEDESYPDPVASRAGSVEGNSKSEMKSEEDEVTIAPFNIRIDFSRDILYFNFAHMCRQWHFNEEGKPFMAPVVYAFLWRLTEIAGISEKVKVVAFGGFTDAFLVGPHLFEFENLKAIILVYGDECCKAYYAERECIHKERSPFLVEAGGARSDWPVDWPLGQLWSRKEYQLDALSFKEEMEEEVKNYKESIGFGDSPSVEEWADLKVDIMFIERRFAKYRMETASDIASIGSEDGEDSDNDEITKEPEVLSPRLYGDNTGQSE